MKKGNTNTTKLGLFVIITSLLFIVSIYYIGNTQNVFGSNLEISSVFQNVKGLQNGNNVRYSGINVGTVDEIIIVDDSTIQVNMRLEKRVKKFLKKDAVASISSDGLVGNMIVNISPGDGKSLAVEDKDFIRSYARTETADMMNTLGNTTENIALLTINLLEIAEKVNTGKGSASTLINDSRMALDLQEAIKNLRITTQHINTISNQVRKSMDEINQGQGLLGYLLKDSTFENQVSHTVEGLDTLIRNRTMPIMDNLETSSKDIAKISADLNAIVEELDLSEGLVGAVLKDSLTADDFRQTMQNLNRGTGLFNENMEALKHNFLFRKYFRKQEKKRKKELKKQEDTSVVDR